MTDALSYERKTALDLVVDENDTCFAIINWEPLNDSHCMVITKRYVEHMSDLLPEEAKDFFDLLDAMRVRLERVADDDLLIYFNTGGYRTQSRLHAHILPSAHGGLRDVTALLDDVPKRVHPPLETLQSLAERIRSVKP